MIREFEIGRYTSNMSRNEVAASSSACSFRHRLGEKCELLSCSTADDEPSHLAVKLRVASPLSLLTPVTSSLQLAEGRRGNDAA